MNPYFTISRKIVLEQFDKVQELCDIVSYSSKTNPKITAILENDRSCFFSVHLENELKNIKNYQRVLYLAQAWDHEFIHKLIGLKINKFVVDNLEDLNILLKYLQENKDVKIDLMLRSKFKENSIKTETYFVFGMGSSLINATIKELKGHEQIKNLGIHFHRKSQNIGEWNLLEEVQLMFSEETLNSISILNIGGGLPSVYANTNPNTFNSIYKKINEFKEAINKMGIKLMIEPGRFIAAPAGKLHTQILQIYDNNIIINASVYNSDMDALIVPMKLLVEGENDKNDPEAEPYVIKGKTPCSMDLFRYKVYLKNPKKGDEIIFINTGAYNFTTDFCDLEKIEEVLID
jgi:ornithine decarboxylase